MLLFLNRSFPSFLAGSLCYFTLAACSDNPNAVRLFSGRTSAVVTPTATLEQSIDQLLSLFPKGLGSRDEQRIQQGQNEDLNPLATWNSIKRKYAAGASDPAQLAAAKEELFRLSDWVTRNAQEMNAPPDGETKTAAAARLVLYMSMYVYGGPNSSPPAYTPAADATVGVVTPAAPATIVTPTLHAGVQLEAGSVAENTIIVVTQNPTPYPDNCSGPLQTKLCQYPQFYTFDMFPHKRLLKGAKFNVCHINSGDQRRPLADHDRFRLAHAKPADPADYTPGSTIRDQNGESIEILPLVTQTFSTCANNVYATNSVGDGALAVMSRLARGLRNLVSPKTAYAIDVGLGGLSFDTSPFNDVDPLGLPDLAVQSFSVAPTTIAPGAQLTLSYTVRNIGTATAGSVPATVFLTPPTVEGPPPVDQLIGSLSIPLLVPRATEARTNVTVTIPRPLPSGTYRVRFVVGNDPVFPDADTTNNSASALWTITPNSRGRALLLYDDGNYGYGDPAQFVKDGLVATGLFTADHVDALPITSVPVSLPALQSYDCVVAWTNDPNRNGATPASLLSQGNLLRSYVDQGGGVVLAQFSFVEDGFAPIRLRGGIVAHGYNPLIQTGAISSRPAYIALDFSTALVSSPVLAGVSEFSATGGAASDVTLDPGATLVGKDIYGMPLVGQSGNRHVAAFNIYPGPGWHLSAGAFRSIANACLETAGRGAVLRSNTWVTQSPLPAPRSNAAVAVIGSALYAIGGLQYGVNALPWVTAYDATTDTWTSKKDMPAGRHYTNGAAAINGLIYVSGGYDGVAFTKTLFVYNPATDSWVQKSDMPVAGGCGASVVLGGYLYVLMGCDAPSHWVSYLLRYDPNTDTWTRLPDATFVHGDPAAGAIGGKLYVVGGWDNYKATGTTEMFDPGSGVWTTLSTSMPTPRYFGGSAVIGGKLYVVGGGNANVDTPSAYLNAAEAFDPATGTWSTLTPMPTARYENGVGVINGLLYSVGGYNGTGGTVLSVNEVYTP